MLSWRLICRQANTIIEADDNYWRERWRILKTHTMPKSFLFHNGILFDSNHVAVRNLPNNVSVMKRKLYMRSELALDPDDPTTDSKTMNDDLTQVIIRQRAPIVERQVKEWIGDTDSIIITSDNTTDCTQYHDLQASSDHTYQDEHQDHYSHFKKVVSHLSRLEKRWPSIEMAQINLQNGLVCFERMLLLELGGRPVINTLFLVMMLLVMFKLINIMQVTWHVIFGLLYLYIILAYSIQLSRQVHHIYLGRAHVHNQYSAVLLFVVNVILRPLSACLSLLAAIFLHLKLSQVHYFDKSFTVCCIPVFIMVGVEWVIHALELAQALDDMEHARIDEFCKVFYTVYYFTVEAMCIFVCLKLDNKIEFAWSLLFSSIDAIFLMCGLLFTAIMLSVFLMHALSKSVAFWIIVEWLLVASMWLCSVAMHVMLDSIQAKGYVVIGLNIVHTLWQMRLWLLACKSMSPDMLKRWTNQGKLGKDELEGSELVVLWGQQIKEKK